MTNTYPDVFFVVQQVSQHMSQPRQPHLQVAFHILKYLKSALGQSLFYPIINNNRLQAFSYSY